MTLNIVDMFCGGGGESTGLITAAHEYGFDVNMSAINHWERAIETHAANKINTNEARRRIEYVKALLDSAEEIICKEEKKTKKIKGDMTCAELAQNN